MSCAWESERNLQKQVPMSRGAIKVTKNCNVGKRTTCRGIKSETTGEVQRHITALKMPSSTGLPHTSTKTGKMKIIPIRHTLTSKLRLEKANPLLSSKDFGGVSESFASRGFTTPSRRSTFHPDMLKKQKPELKTAVAIAVSDKRPTLKRNGITEKRNFGLPKERKLPVVSSLPKTMVSNIAPRTTNVQTNVDKSLFLSLQKKNNPSGIKTKNSVAAQNKTINSCCNKSHSSSSFPDRKLPQNTKHSDVKSKSQTGSTKVLKSRTQVNTTQEPNIQMLQSKRCLNTAAKKPLKSLMHKSVSACDLRKETGEATVLGMLSGIENRPSVAAKMPNKSGKNVAFFSPLQSTYTPINITNTPCPSVLRKRLEDWLVKRGKSISCYRHICCFGLSKNDNISQPKRSKDSRKPLLNETISTVSISIESGTPLYNETITLESSDSTFTLSPSLEKENEADLENCAPQNSSTPEKDSSKLKSLENKENTSSLAHPEALNDLKKLLHSGYPHDQCEQWLYLISKSHPGVKEFPQYWECMAALEEARGDFSSAVDCYGRAIIKGADTRAVDKHLDELWEKFSSLSVSAVENKRTPVRKVAVDKKHIFKSTVIKFALQQKAVKKSSKGASLSVQNINYIVTPVRRSSRKSQSLFRTTPTVKCVNTLEDLELNVRETMEFHGNAVLYPEF